MSGRTYYQRNREVILNRAKDYYENSKQLLRERERERERAKNKYRELSEEEKKYKKRVWKKQIKKKRLKEKN